MNIQQAKEEISAALKVYHRKDENGMYVYPPLRQRPILLIGPPGIGKTAIMEQIAQEEGIGLVSYTMTHHTRQSAIGLPRIVTRQFGEKEYSMTEYTLSEIIASVYECMERTGCREGILFIDEINCVSETLSPVMLQFLQNKTFGAHKVPQGWMIVAAGNPPEYNRSARDFDVVTLDRVREIRVEAELDCWMDYASEGGVHGAILSYLQIHPQRFYQVGTGEDGRPSFVTARGWEDLSGLIRGYEQIGKAIDADLVNEFLQNSRIAAEFAAYYDIYCRYGRDYQLPAIIDGTAQEELKEQSRQLAAESAFEERFTVTGQIAALIRERVSRSLGMRERLAFFDELSKELLSRMTMEKGGPTVAALIGEKEDALKVRIERDLVLFAEEKRLRRAYADMKEVDRQIRLMHEDPSDLRAAQGTSALVREKLEEELQMLERAADAAITRGLTFVSEAFGEGEQTELLVTALAGNADMRSFLGERPNEVFARLAQGLMEVEEEAQLQKMCRDIT